MSSVLLIAIDLQAPVSFIEHSYDFVLWLIAVYLQECIVNIFPPFSLTGYGYAATEENPPLHLKACRHKQMTHTPNHCTLQRISQYKSNMSPPKYYWEFIAYFFKHLKDSIHIHRVPKK